jgi:hypothetical protein
VCRTLPVQHAGRVVGLLTMDNVGEFVAIRHTSSKSNRGLRASSFNGSPER